MFPRRVSENSLIAGKIPLSLIQLETLVRFERVRLGLCVSQLRHVQC